MLKKLKQWVKPQPKIGTNLEGNEPLFAHLKYGPFYTNILFINYIFGSNHRNNIWY